MAEWDIPESWAETTLGEISDFKNGRGFKSSEWKKSGLPIIRIQNVNASDPNETEFNYFNGEFDPGILVENGDLLFCWSGSLGTSFGPRIWLGPKGVLNQHIFKVSLRGQIEKKFYFFQMIANLHLVEQRAHGGVGLTHITKAKLVQVPFLLAPFGEQKRIVAKIESTQEKIKTIEQSVTKAEELIGKYREALLQKAFRGELVPQDPNDEPASKLLERIRADRAKQTGAKKKDDLPSIKPEEIPFEIPKSWEWVRLGGLASHIQYGYTASSRPKGTHRFLRITDITKNGVNWDTVPFCSPSVEDANSLSLISGDILFARTGGTVGKSYLIKTPPKDTIFASYLIKVRPYETAVIAEYLSLYFSSPTYWDFVTNNQRGAAQPNINGTTLGNLLIPLPPYGEQTRLLGHVRSTLSKIVHLEKQLEATVSRREQLLSSILNQAFSGRLVPQDPSEGTGHEVLEKIKSQITVASDSPAKNSRPKKRAKA
jgi:type I restriction enzyme S subunit